MFGFQLSIFLSYCILHFGLELPIFCVLSFGFQFTSVQTLALSGYEADMNTHCFIGNLKAGTVQKYWNCKAATEWLQATGPALLTTYHSLLFIYFPTLILEVLWTIYIMERKFSPTYNA